MDFNNGNDGEKLFEQRNESSVLFSLDSLAAQNSSSDSDSDSPFGGSGDKSGLIDLNTLAEMGSSKRDSDDYSAGAPVFNSVKSRKQKNGMIIGIIVGLLLVIGLVATVIVLYQKSAEEEAAEKAAEAKRLEEEEAKDKAHDDEMQRLKNELASAKSIINDNERKQKAAEDAAKEEAKRKAEEEAAAREAAAKETAARETAAKASGSSGSSSGSKPAAAKGKGLAPEDAKKALQASASKAAKCGKNGNLVVTMTLTSSGKAKNVTAVGGTFKGTPTEKCILTVVEKHNFPEFSGADVNGIRYKYQL